MLKTTLTFVMAMLCLNFGNKVNAQSVKQDPPRLQPLNIGDTIPESVWNLPLQIRNHPEGKQITTLNDYKGKLIILDFWATWCSPCLAMLPKTNELQKQYDNQIRFLPVTYEPESKVQALIKKTGWNPMQQLSYLINDTLLSQLFPHKGIPHYVWLNNKGIIQAITGSTEVSAATIDRMLNNVTQKLPVKSDIKSKIFDAKQSLLSNQPLTDSTLLFSSTLSPHRPNLVSMSNYGYGFYKNRRILIINDEATNLFRLAYGSPEHLRNKIQSGYPFNRTLIAVKDPAYWRKPEHYFCYEQLQSQPDDQKALKFMQQQLEMLLPLKARVEKRKMSCYVLLQNGKPKNNLQPTDTLIQYSPLHLNLHLQPVSQLLNILNLYLGFKQHIILNESSIKEPINIELKTQLTDLQAVKTALKPWGLSLKPATRTIEVLVITDNKLN